MSPRGARGSEYLLEVRSEEIPARMLEPGLRELATRVFEELMSTVRVATLGQITRALYAVGGEYRRNL